MNVREERPCAFPITPISHVVSVALVLYDFAAERHFASTTYLFARFIISSNTLLRNRGLMKVDCAVDGRKRRFWLHVEL